jgi:uncharacterized protein YbjQ (UPF0145 family)
MPFLGFGNSPYMAWPKKFKNFDRSIIDQATYQVLPSPNGVPMVQLDVAFSRLDSLCNPIRSTWGQPSNYLANIDWADNVSNPDMSVVVLMDISGSMFETWQEGHVRDVCKTVLNYTMSANQGIDLILYNDRPIECGHFTNTSALGNVIANHRPAGGTYITEALRVAIRDYKKHKGLYIIVVTDGVFADKQLVSQLITAELMPQLTSDNPFAFRLHFVGHGAGVDHAFLTQLEQLASGKGVQMVTSHHHAHLSHSHGNILDELDRAFIGRSKNFGVEESLLAPAGAIITRVGELNSRHWQDGHQASFPFMPAHAMIGLEFMPHHPPSVSLKVTMAEAQYKDHDISFVVPLPASTTAGAQTATAGNWTDLFKLPLFGSPDQRAADDARKQHAAEVHEAEMTRQVIDLKELAKGGIPVQAKERLKELADSFGSDQSIFTSDLAPDELALLRRCGFSPRGLVTGSAMYHVGQGYASASGDCEVHAVSEAYDQAFALAISRMKQELRLIGAHGVVGVRLNLTRREWSERSIEVQAIGTAVAGPKGYTTEPWTSDLSGQEWYTLWQAGYEPADLVWGHCSWFVLTTAQDQLVSTDAGWVQYGNMEMEHWSEALSSARHVAMKHVQKQAAEVSGCGVVGVKVARRLSEVELTGSDLNPAYARQHHNLLVSIIGTAIRVRANAPEKVQGATYALSLRDGRLKPLVVKQQADLQIY